MNIEFGQIVFSKAGHDAGTAYVVLEVDGDRALVSDGKYKLIEKPKRKNIKHLQPTNYIEDSLKGKKEQGFLRNEDIKRCLKLYHSIVSLQIGERDVKGRCS
ncbi:MAG: KOW domain-containing RNA-binding protein [Lachnospiraceae bacterium]|nr:KOW domain-containing RNA-binding protein [Lachnospiraceae bacterium]